MPAMTIQTFQIKTDEQGNPKKDNYGNTQMMIKFNESPETVYKAVMILALSQKARSCMARL